MHVTALGSGRPVVFLHGMPQAPSDLEAFAATLEGRGLRSLVVHAPGYGRSPVPTLPLDLAATRAAIVDAIRARTQEPVVLVGCSGGAYQALGLVADGVLPVAGLFLVGALPGMPEPMKAQYQAIADLVRTVGLPIEMAMATAVSPAYVARAGAAAARAYVERALAAVPAAVLAAELDAVRLGPDLSDAVRARNLPALLNAGVFDLTTPVAMSEALAQGWPNARVRAVPDAGHDLFLEDGPATAEALVGFVATLP